MIWKSYPCNAQMVQTLHTVSIYSGKPILYGEYRYDERDDTDQWVTIYPECRKLRIYTLNTALRLPNKYSPADWRGGIQFLLGT